MGNIKHKLLHNLKIKAERLLYIYRKQVYIILTIYFKVIEIGEIVAILNVIAEISFAKYCI